MAKDRDGAKLRPKKINLYMTEELQEAAKVLAEGKGVSVSAYISQLIEREVGNSMINFESTEMEALKAEAREALRGSEVRFSYKGAGLPTASRDGISIGIEFRTHFPPVAEHTKLLQSLAVRALKEKLSAYVIVLPSKATEVLVKNFERFCADSAYVPCVVSRAKDLTATVEELLPPKGS